MKHVKKSLIVLSTLLLGIVVTTWYSCEKDDEETCLQDEICEVMVTVCCDNDDVCVYKYDGKEYTEDQVDDLAEELGCGTVSIVPESGILKKDFSGVIEQLRALMTRVRESNKSAK
jgi:hypothetical protein